MKKKEKAPEATEEPSCYKCGKPLEAPPDALETLGWGVYVGEKNAYYWCRECLTSNKEEYKKHRFLTQSSNPKGAEEALGKEIKPSEE